MSYFDADWYLSLYPDVANAISLGQIGSAEEHFHLFGKFEGRSPLAIFNEAFYLNNNPDVAEAVRSGATTAYDHFAAFGASEHRATSTLFDPAWYLARNPDVRQAIEDGVFSSAAEHFLLYGSSEPRATSVFFDSAAYLNLNPDVAAAGVDALTHFLQFGQTENRVVSPIFDGAAYLAANPDVAAAVAAGYITAYDHFQQYGLNEPRDLGNGINLTFFQNDQTFSDALGTGDISTLVGRIEEVAPFIPGYVPPAHHVIPANTPLPTDFTPPAGEHLVIPDGVDIPGEDLPPSFAAAATFANGELVIADGVQATVTANDDGSWTISAHNLRPVTLTAADIDALKIGAGAQLNVKGLDVDGAEFHVSGAGKLNVTDVDFGNIEEGALNAPDLTGISFADVSAEGQRLLSSHFLVNGNVADAFEAMWIAFDKAYYDGDNYYNFDLNTAKVYLANSYVDYLLAGNDPLLQIVQTHIGGGVRDFDARQQSLHDNMLGEVTDGAIADRFPHPAADPRTEAAQDFGDRPWYSGNLDTDAAPSKAWDFAHDIERPDFIVTSDDSDGVVANNNGNLWVGSGNPAGDFHTAQHDGYGIELGLKGIQRGSGENMFDHVDENGYAHYSIPGGVGAGSNWATNWSFNFSIETQQNAAINPAQPGLTSYSYKLLIDVDPTAATEFITLTMDDQGEGNTPWYLGDVQVLADDMRADAPADIYQQSVNYGFEAIKGALPEGFDFNDGGIFDIRLEAYLPDDQANPVLATGIVLDVHAPSA